jgi:hypothetical protein
MAQVVQNPAAIPAQTPTTVALSTGQVMDVVPFVSADGYTIQLNLVPTFTEFLGYDQETARQFRTVVQGLPVQDTPLPRFRIRQVATTAVVWDGQTVVLGGLIAESVKKVREKVPVLGDIPFVGRLFRSESSDSTKVNLVIFVTPTIIDPAAIVFIRPIICPTTRIAFLNRKWSRRKQMRKTASEAAKSSMSVMLNLKKNLIAWLVLSGSVALSSVSIAAASLAKNGTEYPIFPMLPRDQVVPHLSLGAGGGYLICQDTIVDGNGLGIRARRINADLSAAGSTFAVNSIIESEQQKAKVAVLPNGGAVFVWQGSTGRGNKIFARFMGADQQFLAEEFAAADRMFGHQSDAAVAALTDGTVVIVWSELKREPAPDDRMQGVFGQRFSSTGERLGPTFRVNTVTYLNQRTPAIAPLKNGGFVVAWVSDEFRQRGSEYIDIAARLFDGQGNALGEDFALNTGPEICANPALIGTANGFRAAWSSRAMGSRAVVQQIDSDEQVVRQETDRSPLRWEVSTRTFDLQGQALASQVVANNTHVGDQYSPRLLGLANGELLIWTSFAQDGSVEGIVGRVARDAQEFDGNEFLVNTRKAYGQMFPTVGAVGDLWPAEPGTSSLLAISSRFVMLAATKGGRVLW